MLGAEIKEAIGSLNTELRTILKPGIFTLSNRAIEIKKEISEYQSKCPHSFVDGECVFCGKEE